MRPLIIEGTGHVVTFLVLHFVEAEHEVISISRRDVKSYIKHGAREHA